MKREFGERMDPSTASTRLLAEHLARYDYAAGFVSGRRVLDVAAGTGYGAARLAEGGAVSVIALERDPAAIAAASASRPFVWMVRGDAHFLPLSDASLDACVTAE